MRWTTLLTLVGLLLTSPAAAADDGVADYLRRQLEASNTPAAAYAVVRDGRVTASDGIGGATGDTPTPMR